MEKPRLLRLTSVSARGLVFASVLLCVAAVTEPAFAATRPRVVSAPGFDACSAPSAAAMHAWYRTSAYRAVGVYIGGADRACPSGNLTSDWVGAVTAQGWSLIPVYVGLQAPCASGKRLKKIDPAQAAGQGTAEAADAVRQAESYGMRSGSPIYFDLEAFQESDQGCVAAVTAYLNAWTRQLHAQGFYSGVYGSAASGMATLAEAVQDQPSFAAPDAIWIARWDQRERTADGSVPGPMWSRHQRIKQYRGGHVEKHGGVAVEIDSDFLDGPVARVG